MQITPVQDLHGQSNPYPAGGGKNLFPMVLADIKAANTLGKWSGNVYTYNDVTFTVGVDSNDNVTGITLSGTASGIINFMFATGRGLAANNYTLSSNAISATGIARIYIYDSDASSVVGSKDIASSTAQTFAVASDISNAMFYINVNSGTVLSGTVKPQLEIGSSATAWVPYSNICPISGWTGANVTRTGINVWDEEWEVGTLNTATGANGSDNTKIRSKNYIPVVGGESYRFVAPEGFVLCGYDASQNYIGEIARTDSVFTLPVNCAFVRFRMATQYGTTYNHDISINNPSSDTSYHAYTGTTINVNWSDSAGTIYKGRLEYSGNGVWTPIATSTMRDLGNYNYTENGDVTSTGYYSVVFSRAYSDDLLELSDIFANVGDKNAVDMASVANWSMAPNNNNGTIKFKCTDYANATDFKAAMSGHQLLTINTTEVVGTPITTAELVTLLGNNNVWADCGDTSVEYRADTKLYIDKQVANLMAVISSL